jgi:hypothetical protein
MANWLSKLITALIMFTVLQVKANALTLSFSQESSLNIERASAETIISTEENHLIFEKVRQGLKQYQKKGKALKLLLANSVGMAVLPFHSVLLEEVSPKKKVSVKFKKNKVRMAFLQAALGSQCRCDNDPAQAVDKAVKANKDTPKYELISLGDYRGKKIYKLNIYPHRYKRGLLMASGSMQVKLKGLVPLESESLQASASKSYLLVGKRDFLNAMGEWISYREGQGHRIETLASDGVNSAEELKQKIHREIKGKNLDSLLILGNETVVPMFTFKTKFDANTPSDLPYALTGEGSDWIADVDYGRFPVARPSEVAAIVAKIKAYESRHQGPVANLRALGMASNEGVNPNDFEYLQRMLTPMESLGYANKLLHQDDSSSNVSTITEVLRNGVDWVNYIGHGSGTSWPSINRGPYTSDDLLAVGEMPSFPVVIDVACQNGRMSGTKRMGESFLLAGNTNQLSGAVAYFGGTVDISWDPPAIMAIGINQSVAAKKWDTLYRNIMEGQLHLMQQVDNEQDLKDNLIWYHLQGDPGLVLF